MSDGSDSQIGFGARAPELSLQDAGTRRRTTLFRDMLASPELEFICEAHNGISARIAEEAGFRGLWASGLCMSAQYGVRDSNEASWTQILEILEFMADATSVPILVDGDTGYGNFNNVRRLVRKLEQRHVAALCLEDKLFPKTNSFLASTTQPLADIDEFSGKISAAKDAQGDDDFSVVARVEALIAGWGLGEALRRAEAYRKAGADAILIHSKKSTAAEILAFKQEWADRCPVVIVPTKYYATPTDVFRDAGISMVIWANHLLRAAVITMQETARALMHDQQLHGIEDKIAPVTEIFRLQGADELQAAEERYLPRRGESTRAVVLAASRGEQLGDLTETKPKAMVRVRDKTLLGHIVGAYNSVGVKQISVVRGYRKETVDLPNLDYVDNDEFAGTGELYSLHLALKALEKDAPAQELFVSYGDILFKRYILEALLEMQEDFVIAVDTSWRESVNRNRAADYVQCSMPHSRRAFYHRILLSRMAENIGDDAIHGEWMGVVKVSAAARPRLGETVQTLIDEGGKDRAKLLDLFNALVDAGEAVRVIYTSGHWLDVDSLDDVEAASGFD